MGDASFMKPIACFDAYSCWMMGGGGKNIATDVTICLSLGSLEGKFDTLKRVV